MRKPKFTKDWWKDDKNLKPSKKRLEHKFEQERVTKSEDLPELLTAEEASKLFKRSPRTIERWMKSKVLGSFKIRGRYFTTPEMIAQYLNSEMAKHG